MPITPRQYLDTLCQFVSDEPTTPGVTLEQAEKSFSRFLTVEDDGRCATGLDFEAYRVANVLTPRRQLRMVLENTAFEVNKDWNGKEAVHDACRLFEKSITIDELGTERTVAAFIFWVAAQAYAMSILPEIALCRPHDRPASASGGKFPAWHLQARPLKEAPNTAQMHLVRTFIPAVQQKLRLSWSSEEVKDYLGDNYLAECVAGMVRPIAMELNELSLQKLLDAAPSPEEDCLARLAPGAQTRYRFENAANHLFARCHGNFTHLIAGPDAFLKLHRDGLIKFDPLIEPKPERFPGVVSESYRVEGQPNAKVWKSSFWQFKNRSTVLFVRNVPHDLAGALAYCPYRWGMEQLPSTVAEEGDGEISRIALTHEAALDVVETTHAVKVEL